MWWIARVVLRCPPLYSLVLLTKWAVWFPIMLTRHGLNDALDAALTTAGAGRLQSGRKLVGEPANPEHRRSGTSSALKFRRLAAHFLHLFVG
jgi:hypothetical protein